VLSLRYARITFVLIGCASAVDQPCVILKHASTARQAFVSGANWQYVSGDFPAPMKFKSNVTDRNVRKIKELNGKVVIVPENYSQVDLEDARKQCASSSPKAP
jgi:hypothetical protein